MGINCQITDKLANYSRAEVQREKKPFLPGSEYILGTLKRSGCDERALNLHLTGDMKRSKYEGNSLQAAL